MLATICIAGRSAIAQGQPPALQSSGGASPRLDAIADSLRRVLLAASPELDARTRELDAARARAQAAGRPEPAALAAELEEVRDGELWNAQNLRLQLERDFTSRPLRAALRGIAEADVRTADADRVLAERRLAATIDRDLIALAGWAAITRRLGAEDSLLLSAEASLRARFAAGDARYLDVLRLRTERLRIQTERAAAVTEGLVANRRLEGLVDTDSALALVRALTAPLVAADLSVALLESSARSAEVDSLLNRSGRLALADASVSRADAERRLAAAQYRPQIGGFLGVQRFTDERGRQLGPVIGATVSLPFTAPLTLRSRAVAADRAFDAAVARRRATRAELRAGTLAARDRFEAARARVAGYDAALLRGARDERESALASFRSGQLTLVELVDFERALARAEIDRIRSVIDAADAFADLVTGGDHVESTPTFTAARTDDR